MILDSGVNMNIFYCYVIVYNTLLYICDIFINFLFINDVDADCDDGMELLDVLLFVILDILLDIDNDDTTILFSDIL